MGKGIGFLVLNLAERTVKTRIYVISSKTLILFSVSNAVIEIRQQWG